MKHTQLVGKNGVKSWQGLLVIAVILAVVFGLNALLTLLVRLGLDQLIASLLFWAAGALLAALLFKRFALVYEYEIGSAKLVISRIYIRNPRLMLEIYTREIVFLGDPDEARRRWPNASTQRAVTRRAPDPVAALVYVRDKAPHILLMEPNAEMREAISAFARK